MAELKPCPFCGGEADIIKTNETETGVKHVVCCMYCGIQLPFFYQSEEEATEAWNRRAEMANEKRLIDANALISEYDWVHIGPPGGARKLMEDAPTVDAVEVVRCKDCKHFVQAEHGCNHFGYYSHTPWVDEVDFCSYGEKRDGDGNG